MTEDAEMAVAPGKALWLADMIDALLKEIDAAPIDEEARVRFLGLYHATLVEVGSTLCPTRSATNSLARRRRT